MTKRLLFLGNSYLHRGPVPILLHDIAQQNRHSCLVYQVAPEAATLSVHFGSDEVEHIMRHGSWDALVLQEHSTRLTQTLGDPKASCKDAIGLASLFLEHNPRGSVCLVQTWARHPDHQRFGVLPGQGFYPKQLPSPEAMLTELRQGVLLVREALLESLSGATVDIAWVGDAWQAHSQSPGAQRLHDDDGNHANALGQWLTALVLYRTLFGGLLDVTKLPDLSSNLRAIELSLLFPTE